MEKQDDIGANKSKYQTNPNPNTKVTKPNKSHNHQYQSVQTNQIKGLMNLLTETKLMHRVATV
jgi:hypothetical protein